jgi:hypothetical protein
MTSNLRAKAMMALPAPRLAFTRKSFTSPITLSKMALVILPDALDRGQAFVPLQLRALLGNRLFQFHNEFQYHIA